MNTAKAALRKKLKQARLDMPAAERQAASAAIAEQVLELVDWSKVQSLHCFETLHELGEVDTSYFLSEVQSRFPNLHTYTSRQVDGRWQDVSLQGEPTAPDQKFDVIIVPMLGFDRRLHRLGYGGGYYDRFLATQHEAHAVGVCFEIGRVPELPAESHDVPLGLIITEAGIVD